MDYSKGALYASVQRAIASGQLVREPCLFCDREDVHAHHHDYSLPFDVTWLCPLHHRLAHRAREE